MDENGTYRWAPQPPEKPKKQVKIPGKWIGWTAAFLALLIAISTCFYTVDDKQQAVVTTFGKATADTEARAQIQLPFGIHPHNKLHVNCSP